MSSLLLGIALIAAGAEPVDGPTVVVVIGAAGTSEYGEQFSAWAKRWEAAARKGGARLIVVGRESRGEKNDHDRLQAAIKSESNTPSGKLWLILIGHGTFDGRQARFNLRGPDVTAAELSAWLEPIQRPTAIVNCSSASGSYMRKLVGKDRVVITGTKSGFENNFARFGDYLSKAIGDSTADLDKDGQTSLLEAYLQASRRTQEFYETEGRLATEHALLDDNGDGLGTRAEWFRGVRPVRKPSGGAAVDGYRAHQFHLVRSKREGNMPPEVRRKRDELELQVIRLRERKDEFADEEYLQQLEVLLVPLAELYEAADK